MIALIVTLVILGFGLYLIETYIPMAVPIKLLIRLVVIIAILYMLLNAFGIADFPIRRAH